MRKTYWLSLTRDEYGTIHLIRNVTTYYDDGSALSSPYTRRTVTIEQANKITAAMLHYQHRLHAHFAPLGQFWLVGWSAEWSRDHD